MSEIGFCVVGMGMGRARARTVRNTPGARLVCVVDLNTDLAKQVAEDLECTWYGRVEDALQDDEVEVVMVLTPSGLHGEVVIQALAAGRHAIATKPMEVTVTKCDAMIAAADKANKLLAVDFETRYNEAAQHTKYALDNGLFGKPILGEARLKWFRTQKYYDAGGWRGTWKMDGGGALANQTIHCIDLLVWIMGRPKTVWGRIGAFTHNIETEDLGMAMIEFESGAVGTILGTTTFPTDTYWGLEVHGSEGGVLANFGTEPRWFFLNEMEDRREQMRRVCPHQNIVEDFVSAMNHNTPLLCDGKEGRRCIELLTAVYESARNGGTPVSLPSER